MDRLVIVSHEYTEKKEEEESSGKWKPPVLVARHCAYGDEQFVRVIVRLISSSDNEKKAASTSFKKQEEETIKIEYADGETRCLGSFWPSLAIFQGNVWQLMVGSEDNGGSAATPNFLDSGDSSGYAMPMM